MVTVMLVTLSWQKLLDFADKMTKTVTDILKLSPTPVTNIDVTVKIVQYS